MTLVRTRKAAGKDGAGDAAAPPRVAYADDVYAWALQQAAFLRAGRFELIDAMDIADEIAALARTEMRVTQNGLRLVLHHLLKWDHQPERRSRSWALSIRTHRDEVEEQLADNPGLRARIPEMVERAYRRARNDALAETQLADQEVPAECPYAWDAIMTRPIDWPQNQ